MNVFYDEHGEVNTFDLKKENIIGRGSLGVIYGISDTLCFKKYNEDVYDYIIPNYKELALINNLKLNNFYKIYDFLFDKNKSLWGYVMKRYKNEDIDILTMPTSFTLDNFYQIYNSVIAITNNGIAVRDMHNENAIINEKEIIVIDADDYHFSLYLTKNELYYKNMNEIGNLLKSFYYHSLKTYHGYNFNEIYNDIIVSDLAKLISIYGVDVLNQKLGGYKYPIDYIKKLSKTR